VLARSTAGAIDETALFYLRSRGVPERDAKDLLTLSFLREGAGGDRRRESWPRTSPPPFEGWLARRR
jgi:Fe-S cluster assembly protein SufD